MKNYLLYVYVNRWNDFRYQPRCSGVPWLHCWYCDPHWHPHLHHKHRECRKDYEMSEWFNTQIWLWVKFCCTTLLDRCVPQCIHAVHSGVWISSNTSTGWFQFSTSQCYKTSYYKCSMSKSVREHLILLYYGPKINNLQLRASQSEGHPYTE